MGDRESPVARFTRVVETAEAFTVARRWEQAGRAWIEAARVAIDAGATPSARQALDRAGEAFRRDDRPEEARKALGLAADLRPPVEEREGITARIAGLSAEVGLGREAIALCTLGLETLPGDHALLLDTLVGAILGFGRKADARSHVEALGRLGGEAEVAYAFRRGQVLRLDGDLAGAEAVFREVAVRLAGRDGAESGVAAARSELAEIDLLRGDATAAVAAFEEAKVLHEAAGRRALAFRCEAGRVRAAVEGGLEAFPGMLEEGLRFASGRRLVMLEVDLRIAFGMAVAARDPEAAADALKASIRVAEERGARLHAGRARMQLALRTRCTAAQRARWLARAADELEDHVLLAERARVSSGPGRPP